MNLTVSNSTQYKVNEISIVTKGGPIQVTGIFEELNIFDSLMLPVLSGNILIADSIGLSGKLLFDGSEVIQIDITKDQDGQIAAFKEAFRIYKQTDRKNLNQNSEKYILHFVSDELMFSDQQRVNQSYETTYSNIVEKILTHYLKVTPSNRALHENTSGIRKVVIPNLRPLEAIEWCAKRSVDDRNSPNYMFYRNIVGFNFVSLSTLLSYPEILDIRFDPKNLKNSTSIQEMSSARSFEVITQNDSIDKTRSGVNAGTFIGFDPLTKTYMAKPITYGDHYGSMDHGNENPNVTEIFNRDNTTNLSTIDSRKVLSFFGAARKFSEYIKKNDPQSLSKVESYENYLFQRKAILKNLVGKRIKIVMPGNFQLTSGFNVFFSAPSFSKKAVGNINEDESIKGKYLIIATRHIITNSKHETVIEVVTDSTTNPVDLTSNPAQNQALENFA
jgi:hypothetical protein